MNNYQERERLNLLFADLERLAVDPSSKSHIISQQLEELRVRLVELEKHLQEDKTAAPSPETETDSSAEPEHARPSSPSLF